MITSLQNPLVKQMRKLHRAKERREQQLFLLEGTHLVEEACAANCLFVAVCYTPEWQQTHPQLWKTLTDRSQRVEVVSEAVLQAIATTVNPDGVVATVERFSVSPAPNHITLGVALETLQDPGNLGTVIRTSAAAGVDGLWLSADSVDLDHPKVLRVVALSGGFSREEACAELAKNPGMIASFSRALLSDLRQQMSDEEFDRSLGTAIDQIHAASVA